MAILDLAEQLGAQAALADARLADHRHQLARALPHRAVEHPDQQCLLKLATDERRRVRTGHVRAEAGTGGERPVEHERLRLTLHPNGLELLVVEDTFGLPVRLLRDRDPVHRRRTLQTGRRVDDVARDDPLALFGTSAQSDDRLPGADADPDL